ncbi:hypothetical protein BGY98DRAFT_630420 [Russula aff. rugulosa BPL654]|nr:hypothetical protein BGY98DRAFT_630420 [Russula aff. rugulosa BPL654]
MWDFECDLASYPTSALHPVPSTAYGPCAPTIPALPDPTLYGRDGSSITVHFALLGNGDATQILATVGVRYWYRRWRTRASKSRRDAKMTKLKAGEMRCPVLRVAPMDGEKFDAGMQWEGDIWGLCQVFSQLCLRMKGWRLGYAQPGPPFQISSVSELRNAMTYADVSY